MKTQLDFTSSNFLPNKNILNVFSSLRKIRIFNESFENSFLQKSISIGDFFQKAVIVEEYTSTSDANLLLLMMQACSSVKQANEKLNIPNEFFHFLKNNNYLFSLFKELAHQKKSLEDIKFNDIYLDYEEHVEILSAVLDNYKRLLLKNKFYDDITICDHYLINEDFVGSFDEIYLDLDGFLSEYEWEILQKSANLTNIKIYFKSSKLNFKVIKKIAQILMCETNEIPLGKRYELDLNKNKITVIEKLNENKTVLSRGFKQRSIQSLYVLEKISTFIKDGMNPKKIAVILPDENFAQILKLYDNKKYLSYAMGTPFDKSVFYIILDKLNNILKEQKSIEFLGKEYFKKREIERDSSYFNILNFDEELFKKFKSVYNEFISYDDFYILIVKFIEIYADKSVKNIVYNELFFIKNLLEYSKLLFSQALEIFLLRLKSLSIESVGGGSVKAMGLLESRGVKFDGVIIVDFNDDLVPKRSVNEMFLSTKVRKNAGLISHLEHENLQRYYYADLISNAKKVAICYVENDIKVASRFLSEFDVIDDKEYQDRDYLNLLPTGKALRLIDFTPEVSHDFYEKPLSYSRLSTFLECKRKYYYKYVLGLIDEKIFDKKSNSHYGSAVHQALFEYYTNNKYFDTKKFIDILSTKDLSPLQLEIAKIKFEYFKKYEHEHFEDGWKISELEVEKKAELNGVSIYGNIDRIDKRGDETLIIDYKTGSCDKHLQLEFYKALIKKDGVNACFYDLKSGMKFVEYKPPKVSLSDCLDSVRRYFDSSNRLYEPVGTSSYCIYCSYKLMCKGEIDD